MRKHIRLHISMLLVFCFWTNMHLPLFSGMFITYAQHEETNTQPALPVLDTSNIIQQPITTDPEAGAFESPPTPSPSTETLYEQGQELPQSSDEEILGQEQLGTTPPIIPTEESVVVGENQSTGSQNSNQEIQIVNSTTNISSGAFLGEDISETVQGTTESAQQLETNTTILKTIYELTLTGTTTTEWNESITVLNKAELTVIIPEHTTIRKASGNEEVGIEELLLLPEVYDEVEKTHDRQEPTPIEYDGSLAPETVTISSYGEVTLDAEDLTIPELADTILEDTILEDTLPESGIADEKIPEDTTKSTYLYETDEPSVPVSSITETTHLSSPKHLGTEEKQPLQEVFEFGLPGEHLLFSEPITLSYAVPYPEGSIVELLVQHAGDSSLGVHGLSTDNSTSCTPEGSATKGGNLSEVIGGKVTFLTCGASTFTLTYTGGASAPNFVDNGTKDYTGAVLTGVDFPTGSVLSDVDILINFRPIDNESPTGPWGTTNCYPAEKSFLLIHPDGTSVALANAGTYTTPTTTCPQAQILYDQSAANGIVGGAWNLAGDSRQPVGNLSTLNGKSPFGIWTLRMGDNAGQDGVILFGFDLTLKNIECGDGIISSGEVCDDGNIDNDDGCTASCTIEAGRECTGEPSVCTEIPAPSGLRLHYDGSVAGGLFTDISGNGFNGTQFNGVTTGNQNGETTMCFNGTNQYILRATNLVTTYPFTMSTWMKSDTTAGLHGVMSFARSSATNRMRNIEHNGTTIRQSAQNTTARYANATTALTTTDWFLVTAIYNSATDQDIYVNGVYEGTNTTSVTYSSNAGNRLNIGRFGDSTPTNYYDGCVDDVRFYSTALTSGQVYTLYAKPATLTTSATTNASPLLTGTIQGVLDTITLTISGNVYTGTNNGDGTRTLNAGVITPGLVSGTYPTTLTVTNPYGRSVQYTSAFTVSLPVSGGDYCIAAPTSISFPQITTESYAQTGFTTSSGYFELIDTSGADSGYYTTLQITNLSGTTTTIPTSDLARQSTGITLLSGTANTGVVLGSAFSSYSTATGTVTFIKRDPAANSGKAGTYGAILQLRISLPAYIKPDTYAGTITYTLYEN